MPDKHRRMRIRNKADYARRKAEITNSKNNIHVNREILNPIQTFNNKRQSKKYGAHDGETKRLVSLKKFNQHRSKNLRRNATNLSRLTSILTLRDRYRMGNKSIKNRKVGKTKKKYIQISRGEGRKNKKIIDHLHLKGCKELWTKNIMKKLRPKFRSLASCRIEAEKLLKWSLKRRKENIRSVTKSLNELKGICTQVLMNLKKIINDPQHCLNFEDLMILFGKSEHKSTSESFFLDPIYRTLPHKGVYSLNEKGLVMDLFEEIESNSWKCNPEVCNIDVPTTFQRTQTIFAKLVVTSGVKDLVENFDLCSSCYKSPDSKGHPAACHNFRNSCDSKLVFLRHLSPHFPLIRKILAHFYSCQRNYNLAKKIGSAIHSSNILDLQEAEEAGKKKGQEFQLGESKFKNEDEIKQKFHNAFQVLVRRSQEVPIYPCLSCEKLCYRKDTVDLNKMRSIPGCPEWVQLQTFICANNLPNDFICNYCIKKFRSNSMPPTCLLNNLYNPLPPSEIQCLNDFEKMLIQRAKAFQVLTRMGNVSKNNGPCHHGLLKVLGKTFHLPLPIEQTLKKLPHPTEAIPQNQEFFVTVRGLPNKNKRIWQTNVDVRKIYAALSWLKTNNNLYREILLESEEQLRNQIQVLDEDVIFEETEETEETDYQPEKAMLTQRDPADAYYEQYTIQPLNEKRQNETSSNLYQMLKIDSEPIDNRIKDLDLRCFPKLFPFGKNGQYEDRTVPLTAAEFLKVKVLSRHEHFRKDVQYVFHSFHDSNIRALKAGIYHKLNITKQKEGMNAAQCLQKMNTEELEANLTTMFSRLRNSAQFWIKPRSDVNTMIVWYGPVTFFLTLSPSEYHWTDLDAYLRTVNSDTNGKSTSALVATDPVSASRFIENKFRAMLDFLQSEAGPLGKVIHYAWRREYQSRGLQHFHILIWVENAPVIGISSSEEIAQFINQHISCRKPDSDSFPALSERVTNYQTHHHNVYCMRPKKTNTGPIRVCRFSFPRPITENLVLRDVAQSIAGRRTLTKTRLYDLPRSELECNINDYNPAILLAWWGNHDIQFIGEHSCALSGYITKYQTKAEKSGAIESFDVMNSVKTLVQKLWNIGLRVLSNRECGIMEASDTLLGHSLFGTDKNTTIKWVDLSMTRNRKLKTKTDIEKLDESSEDIFCPSMVDTHYPNRPEQLNEMCLFEFVSNHDIVLSRPQDKDAIFYEYPGRGYIKQRASRCLIKHQVYSSSTEPELYFHALLLLFKPWRIYADLKGNEDTFAQAFQNAYDLIETALEHHERLQYVRKSKEEICKAVEDVLKDQNGSHTEHHKQDLMDVENAMNDMISENENITSEEVMGKIDSLNTDQKRIFDLVKSKLENSSSLPLRHFVSGVGGTGKSFLIKTLKMWVKANLDKNVVVAAPTGVAALNINGITIHRLFHLPIEHGTTSVYKSLSNDVLKIIRDTMKNAVLLIIDEISMVSNVNLMYIHLRLTEIFDTSEDTDGWFGKMNIIVFGDLLQLPPVMQGPPYCKLDSKMVQSLISSMGTADLWKLFTYDELNINVRQSEDPVFADVLSRVRIGAVTNEDVNILNTRVISLKAPSIQTKLIELATCVLGSSASTLVILPTRDHCVHLNRACLDLLTEQEVCIRAEDSLDCSNQLKKKAEKKLKSLENDASRTAGLETTITLKVGCKVMLQRNLDITAGLVNGSLGCVDEFIYGLDGKVDAIKVKFGNKQHNLERVEAKFEVMPGAYIHRKQFALSVSFAITIHKCQGISVDSCIVDIGQSIFAHGQTYVALSRVTSLKGLKIINFDPATCKASLEAIDEYNRLRQTFRSDLPQIEKCQQKLLHISDQVWKERKIVSKIQETDTTLLPDNTITIPGFSNPDSVSCYANAVVQALFHCRPILLHILEWQEESPLRSLARSYVSDCIVLNCRQLRNNTGDCFSHQQQQDPSEFFDALIHHHDSLSTSFAHTLSTTVQCSGCFSERTVENFNYILSLPVYPDLKITFENLIKKYETWTELTEETRCEICHARKREKTTIKNPNRYIVMVLALRGSRDEKLTNIKITALPNAKIKIHDSCYVFKSAVFHHGEQLTSGHYTTMLKDGQHFIRADDQRLTKERWPMNAKDLYMIFLEKKK